MAGQPVRRFLKELIKTGHYVKECDGLEFDVTPELLAHWAATFARMRANGLNVPVPSGHTHDGTANRGWVRHLFRVVIRSTARSGWWATASPWRPPATCRSTPSPSSPTGTATPTSGRSSTWRGDARWFPDWAVSCRSPRSIHPRPMRRVPDADRCRSTHSRPDRRGRRG